MPPHAGSDGRISLWRCCGSGHGLEAEAYVQVDRGGVVLAHHQVRPRISALAERVEGGDETESGEALSLVAGGGHGECEEGVVGRAAAARAELVAGEQGGCSQLTVLPDDIGGPMVEGAEHAGDEAFDLDPGVGERFAGVVWSAPVRVDHEVGEGLSADGREVGGRDRCRVHGGERDGREIEGHPESDGSAPWDIVLVIRAMLIRPRERAMADFVLLRSRLAEGWIRREGTGGVGVPRACVGGIGRMGA